jgi:uncharacterized damage-inducible protein DinB
MKVDDMLTLYDYNYWATRRICGAAGRVSAEQFLAPTTHSWGSLHGTLLHTLDTEYGWRMLCQHQTLTPDMTAAELPTLEALEQRWREEEQAMRAYLASLTDADVDGFVRYTTSGGEARERVLWHCLLHVVNHGTQHRSEAAAILTTYGQSPGDIDFTLFLSERG